MLSYFKDLDLTVFEPLPAIRINRVFGFLLLTEPPPGAAINTQQPPGLFCFLLRQNFFNINHREGFCRFFRVRQNFGFFYNFYRHKHLPIWAPINNFGQVKKRMIKLLFFKPFSPIFWTAGQQRKENFIYILFINLFITMLLRFFLSFFFFILKTIYISCPAVQKRI